MYDQNNFEAEIHRLTLPINGQLPRPWMTDLNDPDPLCASVLIIGENQHHAYSVSKVSPERHIDALFSRNKQSCRGLYDELFPEPSQTRARLDRFRQILRAHGVDRVLETNVVCYSTPREENLRDVAHQGGADRGRELFKTVLRSWARQSGPKVIVALGSGTRRKLSRTLRQIKPGQQELPHPPANENIAPRTMVIDGIAVFVVPSFSGSGWNRWQKWAWAYLENVAEEVARLTRSGEAHQLAI